MSEGIFLIVLVVYFLVAFCRIDSIVEKQWKDREDNNER